MAAAQKLPYKHVKLAKLHLVRIPRTYRHTLKPFDSDCLHLTCPDDDNFRLVFLRQSKYVHAKAQARLDNFCTLSTMKSIGDVVWGTPLDLNSKELDNYLNVG
ncbi:hypothetical protein TSMEX_005993 [Taenia solium]|eukprot:TsM_000931700 transcript=TsM_000931700 gene=TsM_000931700